MLLKIPFGKGPLKDSIVYIVRGLYYKLQNKRLPDDHSYLVGGLGDSESCIKALQYLQSFGSVGVAAIGDNRKFDVFSSFCATWYTAEDDVFAASLWGLAFYDRMHIGCTTISQSKLNQINPKYLDIF